MVYFWENGIWNFRMIFRVLQQEYLSWAVNVLTNRPKISNLTQIQIDSNWFQISLFNIHGETS